MTFAELLHLFIVVTCISFTVLAQGPSRYSCKRGATFTKTSGYKLSGHVITTHNVMSTLECGNACLNSTGCKSYNYQETESPLHICQLSSQSKASVTSSSDYVSDAGYSYYDADQYVLPGCSSLSCQNGKVCQYAGCTNSYVCQCGVDFIGDNCETWVGNDGSSSSLAGHSCLYIKKYHGKEKGDGDYWIDPTRSGSPFKVKCDMTTDGGGWTLWKGLTLTSSSSPPSPTFYSESTDYTKLGILTDHEYLATEVLGSFKTATGFTQIRWKCRKGSIGRTIHVKTALNAKGSDVVRFQVDGGALPLACNSYTRYSDDNSIVTDGNCLKWGVGSSGGTKIGKWGHHNYRGSWRTYSRLILWKPANHAFSFASDTFWCDDRQNDNLQAGDNWMVYVR